MFTLGACIMTDIVLKKQGEAAELFRLAADNGHAGGQAEAG